MISVPEPELRVVTDYISRIKSMSQRIEEILSKFQISKIPALPISTMQNTPTLALKTNMIMDGSSDENDNENSESTGSVVIHKAFVDDLDNIPNETTNTNNNNNNNNENSKKRRSKSSKKRAKPPTINTINEYDQEDGLDVTLSDMDDMLQEIDNESNDALVKDDELLAGQNNTNTTDLKQHNTHNTQSNDVSASSVAAAPVLSEKKLQLLNLSSNEMKQLKALNEFIPLTLIKSTNITHNSTFSYDISGHDSDLASHLFYEHLRKGKYRYTNKELCQISLLLKPNFMIQITIDCDWNFKYQKNKDSSDRDSKLQANGKNSKQKLNSSDTDKNGNLKLKQSSQSNPSGGNNSASSQIVDLTNLQNIKWDRTRQNILLSFETGYKVLSENEIELDWNINSDKDNYRRLLKCLNDNDFQQDVINYDKSEKEIIEYNDFRSLKSVYEQRFRTLLINNDADLLNYIKTNQKNNGRSSKRPQRRPQTAKNASKNGRKIQSNDILSGHRDAAVERKLGTKIRSIMDCKSSQYHSKYVELCNQFGVKPKKEFFNFGKWKIIKKMSNNSKRNSHTRQRTHSSASTKKISVKKGTTNHHIASASQSPTQAHAQQAQGQGYNGQASPVSPFDADFAKFSQSAMSLNEYDARTYQKSGKVMNNVSNGSNGSTRSNGSGSGNGGVVEYVYVIKRNEKRMFPYLKQGYLSSFY